MGYGYKRFLIIFGIIVLVFIVLGFFLPRQNLEAIGQGCKLSNQKNLQIDFCTMQKVKINGITEYVNCLDPRLTFVGNSSISCGTGTSDSAAMKCMDLVSDKNYDGKAKVNNLPAKMPPGYTPESYCLRLFDYPLSP
ncbi:hypothetical protein KW805_02650 [Candidatus Pacearchaeota archaeon]|nr:hypothetical protein [Candidatus Pacearchaeota archaeon]